MSADPSEITAHEAERALLAIVLTEPALATNLAASVEPGAFADPRHESLWRIVRQVLAEGLTPDHVTLTAHLIREPQLAGYIPTLVPSNVPITQAHYYAGLVADAAIRRDIEALGRRIAQRAMTGDVATLLADAMDFLDLEIRRIDVTAYLTPATGREDLSWLLNGNPPVIEPPQYGQRDDGTHLFYAGKVNGIFGDPESAKTWLAMSCIVEALNAGERAALVDIDHNGVTVIADHLLRIGAKPDQLANRDLFGYYQPQDGAELRNATLELIQARPAIAVYDSIGEMLPLLGAESHKNDQITLALRSSAGALANVGSCVITIDHLPKNPETRSGGPIGGTAKKRAINGCLVMAEAMHTPAPGRIGKIKLTVEKDRPGLVREKCQGAYAGTFVLDSRAPHATTTEIQTHTVPTTPAGKLRPTQMMERVSQYLARESGPRSGKQIVTGTRGRDSIVKAAIARLIDEGYVTTTRGKYNAVLHHLVAEYTEAEDETPPDDQTPAH